MHKNDKLFTTTEQKCAFWENCSVVLNNFLDFGNNIVYNELIYMGYTISVYDNNGREIDFVAQKGNLKYYIQVAYSVAEQKAYDREMSAFVGLNDLAQKILITNDEIDYSTSVVKHIKLKDFLVATDLQTS